MKRSSLKTWLNGKNPCQSTRLTGSSFLSESVETFKEVDGESQVFINDDLGEWWIDVLDDGTAITYYPFNN